MHGLHVEFHLLACALRDDGMAVVMNGQHEVLGALPGIAEVRAEHVGDVAHEIDRVIPHDGLPRSGYAGRLVQVDLVERDRGDRGPHHAQPRSWSRSSSMP